MESVSLFYEIASESVAWSAVTHFTFINMTVKHSNSLNLITRCLYISFFGLHASVILMTIIRSVRAKEIAMQQRFSLNVMGSHYVLHCSV